MPDLSLFLAALAVAFLVPGPDMILMIQTGSADRRTAIAGAASGLATARTAHVALSALGLSAVLAASPLLYDGVRYAGAAYLAWLGVSILRAPSLLPDCDADCGPLSGTGFATGFRRGLLTSALNPKAVLFCSVLLPQFVPAGEAAPLRFAELGAILLLVGATFDLTFGVAGTALGRLVRGHRLVERVQRWVFGAVLIGFGARLAAA